MSPTKGTAQHPCCTGCIREHDWIDDMPEQHLMGMTREEYRYMQAKASGCRPKIPPAILQSLHEKGFIKRSGKGRNRGWRSTGKAQFLAAVLDETICASPATGRERLLSDAVAC